MNVIKKEILSFTRNGGWVVSIIFALVMVITVGLAISGSIHHIPVGVSGTNSVVTTPIVDRFEDDDQITVSQHSYSDLLGLIQKGSLRAGVHINPLSQSKLSVTILIDSTDSTIKNQLSNLLTSIVYELYGVYGEGLTVEVVELYGGKDFLSYVAPGVLALSVLGAGLFGTSETILQEKDKKTLENVIVTGFNPLRFLTEKILSMVVCISVISAICLVLVFAVTGVPSVEGILSIIVVLLVGEFLFISLGVGLSAFIPNEQVSGVIISLVELPMMFMSGVFFSIYQMNELVIPIANLNPLTHFIEMIRGLTLKQASLVDIVDPLLILGIIGILTFGISTCMMYITVKKVVT